MDIMKKLKIKRRIYNIIRYIGAVVIIMSALLILGAAGGLETDQLTIPQFIKYALLFALIIAIFAYITAFGGQNYKYIDRIIKRRTAEEQQYVLENHKIVPLKYNRNHYLRETVEEITGKKQRGFGIYEPDDDNGDIDCIE